MAREPFSGKIVSGKESRESEPEKTCPDCGLTHRHLYERGLMGCARCYQVFAAEVKRAIHEIHGSGGSHGKS